jgi:hypothetical protein
MRRVVVTPTFAAGLGVVVAAVLAYPMRTVFNYAAPNGDTCKVISCGTNSQAGGRPATGPSHRLSPPAPARPRSGSKAAPAQAGHAPPVGGGGGGTVAAAPQLSYQTSSKAHWGFAGTIVMTFKPKVARQRWQLRFSYPAGRILEVSAGRYIHIQHDRHTAVASWDMPAHAKFPRLVRVSIEVAGHPGPPGQCSFNGHRCDFGRHAGQRGPAGGGGHASKGGSHASKGGGHSKPQGARSSKPANAFG